MKVDSVSLSYWCCSAVAVVAFAWRLPALRRAPRNPILWAVGATLLLAAGINFLAAPAAISLVNRASGVPNLPAPIVYCLIVGESASVITMVLYWRGPADRVGRAVRWWLLVYGCIAAAIPLLFVAGHTPVERRVDFDTFYARTPFVVEMVLAYLAAFAVATVAVAIWCWQWSRVAGRPWLRRGLWVIVAGSLLGVAFAVTKTTAVAARWFGADLDYLSSQVAPALSSAGLVLAAAGFVLPISGERLTNLWARVGRYGAYRRLYPLWDGLRRATPQIARPMPLPWRDIELRLTRRLTEIRDGLLALRDHFDPEVRLTLIRVAQHAGLADLDARAVVEAEQIRAAITAKADHRTYPRSEGQQPLPGGTDGASELAWLSAVSDAFAHPRLPTVTTARRAVRSAVTRSR